MVIILTAGAAEKAASLLRGASAWHPVMLQRGWSRRNATPLMAAALVTDILVIVALLLRPPYGAVAAFCLVTLYTVAGVGVYRAGHERCSCLMGLLEAASTTAFLTRNAAILGAATLVGVLSVLHGEHISPTAGGPAAISGALAATLAAEGAWRVLGNREVSHAE